MDGTSTLTGDVTTGGNTTVGKDLTVKGNEAVDGSSTIGGDSHVKGAQVIDQNQTIGGNAEVKGNTQLDKDLFVKGNEMVAGSSTIGGDSHIQGTQTIDKDLFVTGTSTLTGDVVMGGNASVTKALTVGQDAHIGGDLYVHGKDYIDASGINANDQVIRNVADGAVLPDSTDAVNGGQLWQTRQSLTTQINRVGAGAAALASLHPLDFEPDTKLTIAAGYGHYHDANAAAIGAFYRPNEDVMFSLASSLGTGETMLNAGVSFRIGQDVGKTMSSHLSRGALEKRVLDQDKQIKQQDAVMAAMMQKMQAMDQQIQSLQQQLSAKGGDAH